ncbi:hypothetical protein FF36_03773 [Frankia torreyi]|uniref:Uncharacterized protein n=1 Tax=Frankia torreyi TaxID=1856 RepID=A0A0D8BCT2_9ACTN|nr:MULTISPECIES: hypothetical protein [Frankia]KJE21870.1 hypothetical protein FF36_03773 [Frankia torreyi]KQC35866.1 hypothetical protein UK82_24240 [Frankia sp. ACN1ag]KQM05247.1 hypothetical protein FF86_101715 [Frankia sp. CpI1-P]
MTFDPDVLLAWLADRQGGSLASLYRTIAWYAGDRVDPTDLTRARRLVLTMNELGVLAVDWRQRQWEAQPSGLATLPGRESVALFTGVVREAQLEAAMGAGVRVVVHRNDSRGQLPMPSTWWLVYEDDQRLSAAAARGGLPLEPDAAVRRSATLRAVEPGRPAEPPGRQGPPMARWNRRTMTFQAADRRHLGDGLYQRETYGTAKEYLLCRGDRWFWTTPAEGRYLVGGETSQPLRWEFEEGKGDGAVGVLSVDSGMPLPLAHRRIAVLCTGLPPVLDRTPGQVMYDGVPRNVADRIATSLSSTLKVCA